MAASFDSLYARGKVEKRLTNLYSTESWLTSAKKLYAKAQKEQADNQTEDAYVDYSMTYEITYNIIPSHQDYGILKESSINRASYRAFRNILEEFFDEYGSLVREVKSKCKKRDIEAKKCSGERQPIPLDSTGSSSGKQRLRDFDELLRAPKPPRTSPLTTIEAFNLLQYLSNPALRSRILLLDVRPRSQFEKCHIATTNIVCIDPVACRPGASSQDLEDSLILSPSSELHFFSNRQTFDLIIYYDYSGPVQDKSPLSHSSASTLSNLFNALWDNMGWRNRLKTHPLLLEGGFERWQSIGGPVNTCPDDHQSESAPETTLISQDDKNEQDYVPTSATDIDLEREQRWLDSIRLPVSPSSLKSPKEQSLYARSVAEYLGRAAPSQQSMSLIKSSLSKYDFKNQIDHPVPQAVPVSLLASGGRRVPDVSNSNMSNARFGYNDRPASLRHPSLGSQTSKFGVVSIGKTGLKNLGNTCFMNATLQCLSACFLLSRYLTSGKYKKDINLRNSLGYKGTLVDSSARVLQMLWSNDNNFVAPVDFRDLVGKLRPEFASNDQQDAQEFLVFLLDGIHEDLNAGATSSNGMIANKRDERGDFGEDEFEWLRYTQRNRSVVVDLLQGQLQNVLQCLTCSNRSTTYNVFMTLSLPIPRAGTVSLTDCIAHFVQAEHMHGEDAWLCEKCNKKVEASKKLSISKLPRILILHFKRFEVDGRWRDKLNTLIKFPMDGLDMAPFLSHEKQDSERSGIKYDLFGMVCHRGTLDGGHYTAIVRGQSPLSWNLFDDSRVAPIAQTSIDVQSAYILFYQQSSANSALRDGTL